MIVWQSETINDIYLQKIFKWKTAQISNGSNQDKINLSYSAKRITYKTYSKEGFHVENRYTRE